MQRQHIASLARAVWARAASTSGGDVHPPEDILTRAWPNDRDALAINRAATSPTTSATAAALGETIMADFVGGLVGVSAGAELIALSPLQLAFGNAAAISVPALRAPLGTVGWVGEGQPIPVRELVAGRLLLEPRKIASIIVLTREMVEAGPANGAKLVEQALKGRGSRSRFPPVLGRRRIRRRHCWTA